MRKFPPLENLSIDILNAGSNKISCKTEEAAVSYLAVSSVGPETALVLTNPPNGSGKYWNLLGDHREGYAAAFEKNGVEGMKDYFKSHIDEASPWSSH